MANLKDANSTEFSKTKNPVIGIMTEWNKKNKKIALCFLIYEEIYHEDLWYNFLKNVDKKKYNIYIHYKTNKPLKYFEKYKLISCFF